MDKNQELYYDEITNLRNFDQKLIAMLYTKKILMISRMNMKS